MESALLHCPIRGPLRVRQRAKDELTFTEEKQRIDAVKYLIQRRYPKDNFGIETTLFRIGNAGRNSFRTDFAIYDQPFDDLRGQTLEKRLEHIRLLAEIKRDNASAGQAQATQVRAALNMMPDIGTLGVYWDDIEQRFFYRRIEGRRQAIHDAPINKIPDWGSDVDSVQLTFGDLAPAKNLVKIFDQIDDVFHPHVGDISARYTIIQQLLLLKIHDENTHRTARRASSSLDFQDYSIEPISDTEVMRRMNDALGRAAAHYNPYLPADKNIGEKFRCKAEVLRNATKILAPINILSSKTQVIQDFYMKFAQGLYKYDMGQYFTPHEVIDFIVDLTNPQMGEHTYDPACGSADFLISAFRRTDSASENCVWGADNSEQAVQISILNMVLNGDGKTQISTQDSLEAYSARTKQFPLVLCNPPFGTRILERRYEVLRKFDMGRRWMREGLTVVRQDEVRDSQQTGILFAELCVRLTKAGGRVAIILPNGYLGNRGTEYVALREWLLRNTKLVAIVAFPRFTFKKSGADVSASVVVMERRAVPLSKASDSSHYQFFVGNIECVGWRAGDKKAVPLYVRDAETGALVLNDDNEPQLDADFASTMSEFLRSPAADCFQWTTKERDAPTGPQTPGIDISEITRLHDLNLDPKRHSFKFIDVRRSITSTSHFRLGDILDLLPTRRVSIDSAKIYRYVEIEQVGIGEFDYAESRGWELPDRAKLRANVGDIFVAHLWSSAGKWFMAGGDCERIIVTNGCTRLRPKGDARANLADLVIGLSSEAFAIQIRGFATGSDGLAEISDDDLLEIVLPKGMGSAMRTRVEEQIEQMLSGNASFAKFARSVQTKTPSFPNPPLRRFHWALV